MQHKVISLLQPWASLMFIINPATGKPYKTIETRSWQPSKKVQNILFEQPLLIHASAGKHYGKSPNKISCRELCYKEPFKSVIGGGEGYDKLPFGQIIGAVDFIESVKTEQIIFDYTHSHNKYGMTFAEKQFGDYSENRYGWCTVNAQLLKKPITATGRLNIWEWVGEIDLSTI